MLLTADEVKRMYPNGAELYAHGDNGKQYRADLEGGQIYFAIPSTVQILGYTPRTVENAIGVEKYLLMVEQADSLDELDGIGEIAANDDTITNADYFRIYTAADSKARGWLPQNRTEAKR